jgi:hypothetical protein
MAVRIEGLERLFVFNGVKLSDPSPDFTVEQICRTPLFAGSSQPVAISARERTRARITATVLDLEREMPKIRAFALQQWKAAVAAPNVTTTRGYPWSDEVDTFWDWALLELLVQSGLRIEEASELTTLDILKRKMPDGRIYYLLHIKPSKFDRARVIPIGDGLGRVLAEIIR